MPRRFAWTSWSDERLLELRLKDLDLAIAGTWLERRLQVLQAELDQRGLRLKHHAWLSDEWFSPEATPGIAIPFYLAHPRLMRLERAMIGDVEGGSLRECMRILRHEAGHVVQHSYQLQRRRRWQQLFGRSSIRYPDSYRPNPASKRFVQHLRLWYAQSHPDEDFAETFAVWLKPRSDWRTRYAGWPVLEKLEYVDELMAEIAAERPKLTQRHLVDPLSRLNDTLAEHYAKKQARYVAPRPAIYDRDLRRIFSDGARRPGSPAAAALLRRNRARIRRMVARWTRDYRPALDAVLDDMIARCRELDLRAAGPERQLVTDFALLLMARTVDSLYNPARRQWIAL
ncbi:MAG: putative zinc-binding metallopeptidase [Dongiaceae bacterium]